MKHVVIGGLALLLAAASMPTAAEALSTTVNCPGESIADALNAGFDEITVNGTCTENVEIKQDDVTIQGDGDDTVMGELFANGARRVTIQNLRVQGDGTPGTNGIVAIAGAAIAVTAVVVVGHGDSGIIVGRGATAVLDQVTIRNTGIGVILDRTSSVEIGNVSLIEDSDIGVIILNGSMGEVVNSTIQNNASTGISVIRSSLTLHDSIVQGSPEGVSVNQHAVALLQGNTISTSSADDDALFIGWGSSVRMNGGNTITAPASTIFLRQGATLNQRNGDVVNGPVTIDALSNAEFRNVSITGPVEVVDHSLLRIKDQSSGAPHISVNGNISISQDSGLNFLRLVSEGERQVRVVGNITCADTESSLSAPPSNVMISGNTNGCTGYSAETD